MESKKTADEKLKQLGWVKSERISNKQFTCYRSTFETSFDFYLRIFTLDKINKTVRTEMFNVNKSSKRQGCVLTFDEMTAIFKLISEVKDD
ncbi:MAG: hypothetical protein GYA87_09410 [Christensenellaceae bacterium]|nr:hypothetical protein [Christensenellaceae bacterium]